MVISWEPACHLALCSSALCCPHGESFDCSPRACNNYRGFLVIVDVVGLVVVIVIVELVVALAVVVVVDRVAEASVVEVVCHEFSGAPCVLLLLPERCITPSFSRGIYLVVFT